MSGRWRWWSHWLLVAVPLGTAAGWGGASLLPEPLAVGLGMGLACGIAWEFPANWPARRRRAVTNALLVTLLIGLPVALTWAVLAGR